MTTDDERFRALECAEAFLCELLSPAATPKVPRAVRERARAILRHYPTKYDIEVRWSIR